MFGHADRTGRRLRKTTVASCLLLMIAIAALLAAECAWLRGRQRDRAVAWANEKVAQKLELARTFLAKQQYNEAIVPLEDALTIEPASNRDQVPPLLEEAQRGQADEILNAAQIALKQEKSELASRYLQAYLAHPQARNPEQARRLRDDMQHALSDEAAMRLLSSLSDGALLVFQNDGQLTVDDGLHSNETRAIFRQTLRRHLTSEWSRRQAHREADRLNRQLRAAEQARRVARLRQTHAFQNLTAFLAQIQAQSHAGQQQAREREAELEVLFEQLNVNDPREKADLRADLTGLEERINPQEAIQLKRSEIKRSYRNSHEYEPADRELFDQLVDEEVDRFLKRHFPS